MELSDKAGGGVECYLCLISLNDAGAWHLPGRPSAGVLSSYAKASVANHVIRTIVPSIFIASWL